MKKITISIFALLLVTLGLFSFNPINLTEMDHKKSDFYTFKFLTLDGEEFLFSSLKGKKVMIVNTASECGNTPQYAELETLYKKHGGDDFVIIGFPANNFGKQEPGSNEDIKTFCSEKYSITFPMMAKIDVKGENQHELYKWLTQKELNGVEDSDVMWNFQKYLIDGKGKLKYVVQPEVSPLDDFIVSFIKE